MRACAETFSLRCGLVEVCDGEAEVHLLGHVIARPRRRRVVLNAERGRPYPLGTDGDDVGADHDDVTTEHLAQNPPSPLDPRNRG